ncbi:MAG: glycosyltransferase family 39 protein [Acidimicrobiia bacterium]
MLPPLLVGLLAGVALIGSGAVASQAVLAVLGVAPAPSKQAATAVGLVLAGTAAAAGSRQWGLSGVRRGALLGALVAGTTALAAEVVTSRSGIGWLQSLVVGWSAGVAIWVARPLLSVRLLSRSRRRLEALALGGLLVAAAVLLVRLVLAAGPFGHDESAFAVGARAWVEGSPATGFDLHRAPGLPLLGTLVVGATTSEAGFRLLGVGFALLALVAVAWLGRVLYGRWVGLVAAGLLVSASSFLRRSPEYLTDIPSAALLVILTVFLWRRFEPSDRPGWHLLWAAPLAAAAFYLRYQSVLALAGLLVAGIVLWGGRVRRGWQQVAATAGLTLLLLVPHALDSMRRTASPLGIVSATRDIGGRRFLGQGLVDYARAFPSDLAGPLGAVFLAIGTLAGGAVLVGALRERRLSPQARAAALCLVPSAVLVLVLGVVAHGEPRFLFYPVMLVLVVGSGTFVGLLGRLPLAWGWAGAMGLALVVLMLMAGIQPPTGPAPPAIDAVVVDASRRIAALADGPCSVLTTYGPQVTWYSGCATVVLATSFQPGVVERLEGPHRFLLLFENGKRQPEGQALAGYLALTEGPPVVIEDPRGRVGDARIWRLAANPGLPARLGLVHSPRLAMNGHPNRW